MGKEDDKAVTIVPRTGNFFQDNFETIFKFVTVTAGVVLGAGNKILSFILGGVGFLLGSGVAPLLKEKLFGTPAEAFTHSIRDESPAIGYVKQKHDARNALSRAMKRNINHDDVESSANAMNINGMQEDERIVILEKEPGKQWHAFKGKRIGEFNFEVTEVFIVEASKGVTGSGKTPSNFTKATIETDNDAVFRGKLDESHLQRMSEQVAEVIEQDKAKKLKELAEQSKITSALPRDTQPQLPPPPKASAPQVAGRPG